MTGARNGLPRLRVLGIGAWASGAPDWHTLRAIARGEGEPQADAPRRPAPDLLPANERRRAPETVLLALQVAQAACRDADVEPEDLPSIFASTHGDLAITDVICRTLAQSPQNLSPTQFHNSVHNAASGYWTIGCRSHAPSTALSAHDATLAQGLLEATMQLVAGADTVLLAAYDGAANGPVGTVSPSVGLLGLGLVLALDDGAGVALDLSLRSDAAATPDYGHLRRWFGDNAMAPALELVQVLAGVRSHGELSAGAELSMRIEAVAR